jgi:hypothetical protein
MHGEAKAPLDSILDPFVLLGPVVRPPAVKDLVLNLKPQVFLKRMVFSKLVLLPLVDGGQRLLLKKGKTSDLWICAMGR